MVDVNWTVIAAVDEGGGIGLHGKLPWSFPEDLKHFKRTTMGQVVLVGWKTYQSMPSLQGRHLLVLEDTRSVLDTVRQANELARNVGASRVFLAGGAASYNKYHMLCDAALITRIPGMRACDTFFDKRWLDGLTLRQVTPLPENLSVEYYSV